MELSPEQRDADRAAGRAIAGELGRAERAGLAAGIRRARPPGWLVAAYVALAAWQAYEAAAAGLRSPGGVLSAAGAGLFLTLAALGLRARRAVRQLEAALREDRTAG